MKAVFQRKPCTIKNLIGYRAGEGSQYTIEEVVELEPEIFEDFAYGLLDDQDFIKNRTELMYRDGNGVWHCILVRAKGRKDGILVESEGYEYARYAAYYPGELN